MVFTLIENGDIYTPDPIGVQSILIAGHEVVRVGQVDRERVLALDLPCEVIDAGGCVVTPGFIDPHAHIIGAAGEQGFATRTPEVPLPELVEAGITTVVGLLGTDTTTRNLTSLLAKARQLDAEGITAYIYTGGFPIPPPTITGSVTDDLVLIDKVIGVGEIAISDVRSSEPSLHELARLVSQAIVGGMIGGKAGVTHFHTGPGRACLSLLHALLDQHEIPAHYLYATHINRSTELMDDAIALANRGAYVDIDTVDGDLGERLVYYVEHNGPMRQLTVSSDAHTAHATAGQLFGSFVSCVREFGFALVDVLPLFTHNPATVLKLEHKGRLAAHMDADLLVLDRETLDIIHVCARGRLLLKNGSMVEGATGAG